MIYLLIIDKYILLLMRKGVSRIIRPIGSASDNENGKFFKIRKTIEFSYIFNNEFFFFNFNFYRQEFVTFNFEGESYKTKLKNFFIYVLLILKIFYLVTFLG